MLLPLTVGENQNDDCLIIADIVHNLVLYMYMYVLKSCLSKCTSFNSQLSFPLSFSYAYVLQQHQDIPITVQFICAFHQSPGRRIQHSKIKCKSQHAGNKSGHFISI